MGTGEIFLNRTTKSYTLRSTIDKWSLIKLKRFCKAKDTVNKTKWPPADWEKTFTNSTSNGGLIFKIYKELKKLGCRELNIPILKKMEYRDKQRILN
jgi:phage-related protein